MSGTWSASSPGTAPLRFGGPPYCYYSVSMTNIAARIEAAGGSVTSADVSALMTEAALEGCPYGVDPPNRHTYTLDDASIDGDRIEIRFRGGATNYPSAALSFSATVAPDRRTIQGVLSWQRTDQPTAPNLQWRVTSSIILSTSN
jgi:hypothetical protein